MVDDGVVCSRLDGSDGTAQKVHLDHVAGTTSVSFARNFAPIARLPIECCADTSFGKNGVIQQEKLSLFVGEVTGRLDCDREACNKRIRPAAESLDRPSRPDP